ncbi:MAG: cobalamin-dependent protein, partial [Deltaproteobacteria bacterium]|nr:cobalamin-dependent protein [Deltaproteobacteria bacterium]
MDLDVILVHAPSVYDFRGRDDVTFPYLGNSDSVHVSPVFEMPPVGLLAIQQHLRRLGHDVELFNLASQMLRDDTFDVPSFLKQVRAPLFGVDLHWMAHCHGALALAELYKGLHPDARVMVGGLSATYFHDELLQYPQV